MKTLAVIYGLFEGPLIGKAFIAECERRGYDVIDDANKADVIVAHSGGCLFIPEGATAEKIVLIDAGHKSNRSFAHKFTDRIVYDLRHVVSSRLFFTWLFHRAFNIWYLISRFPLWLEMARRYNERDIVPLIKRTNVAVIQSDDLSWYDAETMTHAHKFIMLGSGCHDNCWIDPAAYLDTI